MPGRVLADTGGGDAAGRSVIADGALTLEASSEHASVSPVAVTGQAFAEAERVEVLTMTEAPWDVQYQVQNQAAVAEGDVLLATVYLRCQASMTGECFADMKFELSGPNWDNDMHIRVSAADQWKRYDVPFKATRDYQPGEARLTLQLGHGPQQVDIGGIELTNYGPGVDIDTLPATELTYDGRDLDAAWRDEAAARIEALRKGNIVVRVTDAQGEVVEGARVHLRMKRHAFGFGSAVVARDIAGQDDASLDKYRDVIESHFNEVVFENDLKWNPHEFGDPADIDAALQWLEQRGIGVRGHVLVWPSWGMLPASLRVYEDDHDALRAQVIDRVSSAVGTYRGRLLDWDVLNEPYNNHDLMDLLGDEVMVDWFKAARAADPEVNLYINDWGILTSGNVESAHVKHYHKTITYLIDQGAPLDGIGMQGHFGAVLTPPTKLLEVLDHFATFGKTIKVTELDMVIGDDALRADYMRDVMTLTFSHASVDSILLWGFWADRHWKPDAALYGSDWSVRPHGQAWLDLVKGRWWTDEAVETDARGEARLRGFKGAYTATVQTPAGEWTVDFDNHEGEDVVEVRCR